jgi:hypothetical protein
VPVWHESQWIGSWAWPSALSLNERLWAADEVQPMIPCSHTVIDGGASGIIFGMEAEKP